MCTSAVSELEKASFNISVADSSAGTNVRHSLCSFIVDRANFLTSHLEWRGQFVADLVADRIVSAFVQNVVVPAAVTRFFPSDPKLLERAFLGIFLRRPDVFRLQGLGGIATIDSREIDFRPANAGAAPAPLRGVTNEGMAAFASDLDLRGVVTPMNNYFPGIDGIARFAF
jgi:hypothetical protein